MNKCSRYFGKVATLVVFTLCGIAAVTTFLFITTFLLLVPCEKAEADDGTQLRIHLVSDHFDRDGCGCDEGYNERNTGVGWVAGDDASFFIGDRQWRPAVGVYRNSYDDTTVYGGAETTLQGPVSVALGLATGYNGQAASPMVALNWRLLPGHYRVSPLLTFAPGYGGSSAVLLSVEIR